MCVSPLKVKNNSVNFRPWCDRYYNIVPCGKCFQCQEKIKNDYLTRSLIEYEYTHSIGGSVYFYTLTYNDDNLPKFNNISCFNKADVQKFFKRLRKLGYIFKYFLTSEYGSQNTLRPHYHLLFFLPYRVSSVKFYDDVKKTWHLGFVKPGNNYGFVNSTYAVTYVSKYISKDSDIYDLLVKKGWHEKDIDEFKQDSDKGLCLLPFHLQSRGFGISLNDILTDDDLINGFILRNTSDGLSKKFSIPNYNKRKLLYDRIIVNDKVLYKLNNRGVEVSKSKIKKIIVDDMYNIHSLLNQTIDYKISPLLKSYNSLKDIEDIVMDLCYNDLFLLSSYKNFYYGRKLHLINLNNLNNDIDCVYNSMLKDICQCSYTDFTIFQDFDKALFLVNELNKVSSYSKYVTNTKNYNSNQLIRSLHSGVYTPKKIHSFEVFSNLRNYNYISHFLYTNQIKKNKFYVENKTL